MHKSRCLSLKLLLVQWQHRELPNSRAGANCKVTAPTKVKRSKQTDQSVKNQANLLLHALSMCRFRFRSQFQFHLWVLALGFSFAWCLSACDLLSRCGVFTFVSTIPFLRYVGAQRDSGRVSLPHTQLTHGISTEIGQKVVKSSRWQDLPFVFRIISDAHRPHQLNSSPTHRLTNSPTHRLSTLSMTQIKPTLDSAAVLNVQHSAQWNNTVQQVFFLATSLLVIKVL